LIVSINMVASEAYSQKSNFSLKISNTTVEKVLDEIEKQSEFVFLYSNELLNLDQNININVHNEDIYGLLEEIFSDQTIKYTVIDNKIILSKNLSSNSNTTQQTFLVTGKVVDANGDPLPGVNVYEKSNPQHGVITGVDGTYSIEVDSADDVLIFSFIGFDDQEITVGGTREINVTLMEETTGLDEVVVTALGIKREQKALGYAVSTVKSVELVKTGSTNFGSALYGKAAGVRIQSAPGGATSAVNIQVRGANSISFSNQPLIIMDGVPIRNGENNNDGYWGDQRIRGNGLIDINPEDIENISILKGASASALYGSEAANGVVLITTKKGKKKSGLGVDVNYTYTIEDPAFAPPFQNKYGPGYDRATNMDIFGADEDGWVYEDLDGDGEDETPRPIYRSYAQFGPQFDGRQVIGWDNKMHPYVAQKDNWKNLFRQGFSSIANVAINQGGDFGTFRLSYTRTDYQGVSRGSDHDKNSFNLNSTLNLHDDFKVDIGLNYVNQYTLNRPYKISRITNNFGGFFSRFDDAQWYLDNYQTSKGYKFRTGTQESATPDENLSYNPRAVDLLDFFWRTLAQKNEEFSDRLISNVTARWNITKDLSFRGRVANDFTVKNTEHRAPNPVPLSINNGGSFSMASEKYSIFYGDALLNYMKDINEDFSVNLNLGFQGRRETAKNTSAWTDGGLSAENWYHLNASVKNKRGDGSYTEFLKYAWLGTAGVSFKDYLFAEFTGRQETSSTLPPGSNSFFYPSVNSSFIISEAFEMPYFLDYAKIRVAYGIVGNAPPLYAANNAYQQRTVNDIVYNTVPNDYGNDKIRPEEKHEFEIGLDLKFFKNRLGIESTYYNNKIVDQILWLSVPKSVGASRMLSNVGELKNYGFEAALYGSPIRTNDFVWDLRANFAVNRNEVVKLMEGVDRLTHRNIDAGAALLVSEPGRPMGDIYAYVPKVNDKGQKIVNQDDGLYEIDFTEQKRVGNVTPDIVGGFGSYLEYKNVFLDFAIDYKFGGEVINVAGHYMKGAGMFEETLKYRDEANGGVSYYENGSGDKILTDANSGPNGERVYHDGVILPGVTPDGSENNKIVDAANYYLNTFTWGANPAWGIPYSRYDDAVQKNNYIKFRELAIGYNVPKSVASKIKCSNIRVSLIANNLFYIYRTLKQFDSETTLGSGWVQSSVIDGSSSATRSFGFSLRASF
jgi:iron complex outermembrane receptor protein